MVVGMMLAVCLISLFAAGCKKQEEKVPEGQISGFARPQPANVAKPAEPPLVVKLLPKADLSVPLTNYVKLEDGNQLMFMYYALSELPIDYEKIAGQYSREFQGTSDGFKRQDILTALKPRIDAEIVKAKSNRYFVHTITGSLRNSLHTYDFAGKSFPLAERVWSPDVRFYFMDSSSYEFSFTNGEEFKTLRVEDADLARKIEGMISSGQDVKLAIYAFAQEADPSKGRVKAQIVKMQFSDTKGKDLLSK